MKKENKQLKYPKKYFEVLRMFNLVPDFKLTDYEKEVVKLVDKSGMVTAYDLADTYDLRPSEVKEIIDSLIEKGVMIIESGNVTLTVDAIRYIRSSKEERKTEKKFKKFLGTLNEADLEKLIGLVNSFEVNDKTEENPTDTAEGEQQ